jgi:hypothetical protein
VLENLRRLGLELVEPLGIPRGQVCRTVVRQREAKALLGRHRAFHNDERVAIGLDDRGTGGAGVGRRLPRTCASNRHAVLIDENGPAGTVGLHRVLDDTDVAGRVATRVVRISYTRSRSRTGRRSRPRGRSRILDEHVTRFGRVSAVVRTTAASGSVAEVAVLSGVTGSWAWPMANIYKLPVGQRSNGPTGLASQAGTSWHLPNWAVA